MKKSFVRAVLAYFFLLFIHQNLFSQCESVKLHNSLPTIDDIGNIVFTQSHKGFIATKGGEIFKTLDEGKTWVLVYKGIQDLNSITFYNNTGYAVGWWGEFLRSDDEGETWKKVNINSTEALVNIYFVDKFIGFISGYVGKTLKTSDGGESWTKLVIPDGLSPVQFISKNVGFAASAGAVHKTEDGGNSWSKVLYGVGGYINKFFFINESVGFGVGGIGVAGPPVRSIIIKTTDGGKSWQNVNVESDGVLNGIYFTSDKIGYSVGEDNIIVKTADGGENWKNVNTVPGGFGFGFNDVTFTNDSTGYVAGRYGQILKTENSGSTWKSLTNFSISYLTSSHAINDSVWFASGETGTVFKTTNKGKAWAKLNSGTNDWLEDIKFINDSIGYAVGGDFFGGTSTIIKTENAGLTWTKCINPVKHQLHSINFIDENIGYVVGKGGTIIKTINKGLTWNSLTSGTTESLKDVFFTGVDTGYVVGVNGIVLKTTDGNTWTQIAKLTDYWFNSVFFIDKNTGYVGGGYGELYKTTNAGVTWTKQIIPFYLDIQSVNFYNKDIGFFGGDHGEIFKTINGGNTWSKVHRGGMRTLDIEIFNEKEILAVGAGGSIVTIVKNPPVTPEILGRTNVCTGKEIYTVQIPLRDDSYEWFLSDGGTLKNINIKSCEVEWKKSGTFTLSLIAKNECGVSPVAPYNVYVNLEIPKPEIIQQDSILISTEGNNYQWYFNDKLIEGAVSRNLKPETSGEYKVRVEGNCTSIFSNAFSVIILSTEDDLSRNFKFYPIPCKSYLTVSSELNNKINRIEFREPSGRQLNINYSRTQENDLVLNLEGFDTGIYILNIHLDNRIITKRIIVSQ